jgi:hypothetical protein
VAVASGNIDNQKQKLLGFDGQLRLAVSNANLYGDYFRATSDTARQNAKLKYEAAIQSQTMLQNYGNMIAQLNQTAATYYGNSSQAALAGMNVLAAKVENT